MRREKQSYVVGWQSGSRLRDTVVIGNEMGWFCRRCTALVLNRNDLDATMKASKPDWDEDADLVVLGIANWAAADGKAPGALPMVPFLNPPPRKAERYPWRTEDRTRNRDRRAKRNERKKEKRNRKRNR